MLRSPMTATKMRVTLPARSVLAVWIYSGEGFWGFLRWLRRADRRRHEQRSRDQARRVSILVQAHPASRAKRNCNGGKT